VRHDAAFCGKALAAAACAAALLASGCRRGNTDAPPPGERARTASEARPSKEEKRSAFARFLGPDVPAGYAWDGQRSRATVNLAIDAAYERTAGVLRLLKFTVSDTESRLQGATGRIVAANAAKTAAVVTLESKSATTTLVKVKVSETGDRGGSERILEELDQTIRPAPAKKKQ